MFQIGIGFLYWRAGLRLIFSCNANFLQKPPSELRNQFGGGYFFAKMKSYSLEVAHDEPLKGYDLMLRSIGQDKTLTLEAKGLFWYLYSLPKGWEIRMDHLQKELEMGRDALRRVFRRLQESGYMRLETLPMVDKKFVGKRWKLYTTRQIPDPLENQSVDSPVGREVRGCSETTQGRDYLTEENTDKELSPIRDSAPPHPTDTVESREETKRKLLNLNTPAKPESDPSPSAAHAAIKRWGHNYWTEEKYDAFISEHCPLIEGHRPDLFGRLVNEKWHKWDDATETWKPIKNIASYLMGLEAHMEKP